MIEDLDHIVLTVADISATCSFYSQVLGMEVIRFGEGRQALRYGRRKINLHQHGREFMPKARRPTPGSADLCFLCSIPLEAVQGHLARHGVDIIEGPVRRTGATGPIRSLYLHDPDGNLIELAEPLDPDAADPIGGAGPRPQR